MCTGLKYNHCMGRNYDYEQSYNEEIINLPKNYKGNKHAIIGIGTGYVQDYPLLYDAMNEQGLCCCALAFTDNAVYNPPDDTKYNIPAYDFVHKIVGNAHTVQHARKQLENANITNKEFDEKFPNSPLHWLICDHDESIVVEQTSAGLQVHDNHYNVLTNNPPFPLMVKAVEGYEKLVGNSTYPDGEYKSRGVESLGVKGDTTSMGRFSRVYHYMEQMKKTDGRVCLDDASTLHLLDIAKQTYGATPVGESYEYTIYSVVYDMDELEMIVKPYSATSVRRIALTNKERRIRVR